MNKYVSVAKFAWMPIWIAGLLSSCAALFNDVYVTPRCDGCDSLKIEPYPRAIWLRGAVSPFPIIPIIPIFFHDNCFGTEFRINADSSNCPSIFKSGTEFKTQKASTGGPNCLYPNLCVESGDTIILKTTAGIAKATYKTKSTWSYYPFFLLGE